MTRTRVDFDYSCGAIRIVSFERADLDEDLDCEGLRISKHDDINVPRKLRNYDFHLRHAPPQFPFVIG